MRGVMLEVPEELLAERRRIGVDRFDEVWEGVLHMVPPPTSRHQRLEGSLYTALREVAVRRDLEALTNTGVYDPVVAGHKSYRVPDITVAAKPHISERGIEGRAELVVEILSPNDESHEKLPFYERVGVREVWLVDSKQTKISVFGYDPTLGLHVRVESGILRISDGADMYEVDIRDSI